VFLENRSVAVCVYSRIVCAGEQEGDVHSGMAVVDRLQHLVRHRPLVTRQLGSNRRGTLL